MLPVEEKLRPPMCLVIARTLQQVERDWKQRQVCLQGGPRLGM